MGKKLGEIFPQEYIVPFVLYIITPLIVGLFTQNKDVSIILKFIVVSIALYYYRAHYKFKVRLGGTSFFWGLLIFILWVALSEFHMPAKAGSFEPGGAFVIFIKLLTGVILAPIIEEFFTRFYLLRILISENWKNVPLGKFTWTSFIVTVLFFGFSHTFWISGLVAGVIFNVIYYIYNRMDECVMAHAWANLLLGIFVIISQEYSFW